MLDILQSTVRKFFPDCHNVSKDQQNIIFAGSRLSSTEIVAIVVASVAFIAFLVTLALLLVKMKKQGKGDESEMRQITDTKSPLMNEDKGGVM